MNYYVLRDKGEGRGPATGTSFVPKCVVAIGRVDIPTIHRRPQMVTGNGNGHVKVHGNLRWGEPLDEGIASVLCRQLGTKFPENLFVHAPWNGNLEPSFLLTVTLEELAFDAQSTRLRGRCDFWERDGERPAAVLRFEEEIASGGNSPEKWISALKRLLGNFSGSIGDELSHILRGERGTPPPPGQQKRSREETATSAGKRVEEPPGPAATPAVGKTSAAASFPEGKKILDATEIILGTGESTYVTVDDGTGKRLFSGRILPGQRIRIPRTSNLRIHSSNPRSVSVDGRPLSTADYS